MILFSVVLRLIFFMCFSFTVASNVETKHVMSLYVKIVPSRDLQHAGAVYVALQRHSTPPSFFSDRPKIDPISRHRARGTMGSTPSVFASSTDGILHRQSLPQSLFLEQLLPHFLSDFHPTIAGGFGGESFRSCFGTGPSISTGQGSAQVPGLSGEAVHSAEGALPLLELVLGLPVASVEDPIGNGFPVPVDSISLGTLFTNHSHIPTRGSRKFFFLILSIHRQFFQQWKRIDAVKKKLLPVVPLQVQSIRGVISSAKLTTLSALVNGSIRWQ